MSVTRIHELLARGQFDDAARELEQLESAVQLNDERSVLVWAMIERMKRRIGVGGISSDEIKAEEVFLTDRTKFVIDSLEQELHDRKAIKQHASATDAAAFVRVDDKAPRFIVVCEGSSIGNRRKDFDSDIYNRILKVHFPDVIFVSGGSSNEIAKAGTSIRQALASALPNTKIVALCDRDDKSAEEVADFERNGDIVLPERNLESFLFADDVIEALLVRERKPNLLREALEIKQTALASSVARKNAPDDLKSAAGEIYVRLKQLLGLTRSGNSVDMFMRDTLSPLVRPPIGTYNTLKAAIINRLVQNP